MDQLKISYRYFKISLNFFLYLLLSTIFSDLFAVLHNILIQQEYKFRFSHKEAGVTPELLEEPGEKWRGGGLIVMININSFERYGEGGCTLRYNLNDRKTLQFHKLNYYIKRREMFLARSDS